MNKYQKSQVFHLSLKISSLKNQKKFYKNMLYYTNLEYDKLFTEIKKHNKEFDLYTKIKNGEKINTTIYSNLSTLIECEKTQKEYTKKIEKIENEIKKCKDLQSKIIYQNEENNLDLNKILNR